MASEVYTGSWRCCPPNNPLAAVSQPKSLEEEHLIAKIHRAERSGPYQITKDATVAEYNRDGTMTTLRKGTNDWVCFPGNENEIGNVPMCCDPQGLQWMMDALSKKPKPTNTAPG